MTRRRRRESARRLRDATRAALRKDLAANHRTRAGRGWRKPLVLRADGDFPRWVDFAVVLLMIAGLIAHWGVLSYLPIYCMLVARKLARRPTAELSGDGVRLLRARPQRTIPWKQIAAFDEGRGHLRFDELRLGGEPIRHTLLGVGSAHQFRAAAIFRAQTAANVFD